ncbi:MAG: serine/threonine protein kinase [Planctomycetaceae bacterium]
MALLATATEFIKVLHKSALLPKAQFLDARKSVEALPTKDAASASQSLVKAGVLSRLQASWLLEGRKSGFFLGDYRVEELLGQGGMGLVCNARHKRTGEEVAIKLLSDKSSRDAGLVTRFRLEAEAGKKLNHPGIIRTREVHQTQGLYGDVHFMVMDLVRGISVDELVTFEKRLQWPHVCGIARQIADALQHAHQHGLVHRDVKPNNVLLDPEGRAYLLDFGLSLASQSTAGDEFSLAMLFGHNCMGTADFIAPEQAIDSLSVDGRADVYSLGGVMYFMLTGRPMFAEHIGRPAKISANIHIEPRPIQELVPSLPDNVAKLVHRMLAKNREQRFATAQEVSQTLASLARPRRLKFEFQEILGRRFKQSAHFQDLANSLTKVRCDQTVLPAIRTDEPTSTPKPNEPTPKSKQNQPVAKPKTVEPIPTPKPDLAVGPVASAAATRALRQGIDAAKSGDEFRARWNLESALKGGVSTPEVWLWLAWMATTPTKAQEYLKKLAEHSEFHHAARCGLEWLSLLTGDPVPPEPTSIAEVPIAEVPIAEVPAKQDVPRTRPPVVATARVKTEARRPSEVTVISCPNCDVKMSVQPKALGRSRVCPACEGKFLVELDRNGKPLIHRLTKPTVRQVAPEFEFAPPI